VDNRDEVRAFLSSRRAKITPEQAGVAIYGRNRRVPGLRRSEVADLAGVSVEYYAQLERGDLAGVSESVLDALSRALQLSEAEREHLLDLARAAGPARRARRRPPARQVRPSVARVLDGMTEAGSSRPVNLARFNFLSPHARTFWGNWERAADDTVAMLRTEAGRDPYDKGLAGLVGELSTRSDEFRVRWGAHDVRLHRTGLKHIRHPVVGDLRLSYDVMELPADPGLALVAFSAESGSPDDDALRFLASWAATHEPADALTTPDQT
jgi:transcriptional regulator with XRE-family HTH domain